MFALIVYIIFITRQQQSLFLITLKMMWLIIYDLQEIFDDSSLFDKNIPSLQLFFLYLSSWLLSIQ